MLTEIENKGIRKILHQLDISELLSLVDTVAKRKISAHDKSATTLSQITSAINHQSPHGYQYGAIDAILRYTGSSDELLRRKRITRDCLYQYLVQCNIKESINCDKNTLIARILSYWGSDGTEGNGAISSVGRLQTSVLPAESSVFPRPNTIATGSGDVPQQLSWQQPVSANNTFHPTVIINQISQFQNVVYHHAPMPVVGNSVSSDLLTLANEFFNWFFNLLNSHNPLVIQQNNQQPLGDFGPHHFWQDVRMQFSNDVHPDEYLGSMKVSEKYLAFVREDNVVFKPNLSTEGLKAKSEAHGLVLIMTCGTIHKIDQCLGVFEQVFGLVRDPTIENKWKIKLCRLKIHRSDESTLPQLRDANEFPSV